MSTMTMDATGLNLDDTRSHALVHARIMLRRNLRHMRRYPSLTLMLTLMPLVFLLLFVYIFGGTLGSGLGGGMPGGLHGGRSAYANYVAPAIIVMAVAAAAQGTAIAVAQDMKIGDNLIITIAWCLGVAVLSYAWSRRLYERQPKAL
jgi:ABC-2 type transport system permease protein